ncbi:hypothetical protein K450DRAFT_259508 [Umbelopsis ramanniana AG]|uniref:Uncharacterized protein n=1 Tax=Umbelopsis ramanniana AG TaxID=1314678 RepID=A0AAD5H8N2_UMBRA|nr:uncharacterized protein K450DRAFT_259508 [Umbelopsis ramanniana AG]KAI8575865.1 hypothetical protein K450DRAFT_259508 [Umbelopsis ramanniana AG]
MEAIGKVDMYFTITLDPRSKFAFCEKAIFQQRFIDIGKKTVRLAWWKFRPVFPSPTDSAQLLFQQVVGQDDDIHAILPKRF